MLNYPLSNQQKKTLNDLSALPYLQGYNEAPEVESVTVYDRRFTHDGSNLIVSADSPTALLLDMKGIALHEWRKDFEECGQQDSLLAFREILCAKRSLDDLLIRRPVEKIQQQHAREQRRPCDIFAFFA